ncbi:MAG TPA: hypothetical protein VFE17_04275 [Candidatus Baltobacteraceae bacterium]|jgi:hypothetical protein|nr:hypothetical protein [Candidatus Baltobacteraceae bacterium]
MRRFAVILGMLQGLFMLVDGLHAWITGSYFAPGGQVGPWAGVVAAAGIPPFSLTMKLVFVILGGAYILSGAAYALYPRRAIYFAAVAVLTLWYLPLGTILSLIVLVCIALSARRPNEDRFV